MDAKQGSKKIAVLGAGNVGGALARIWAEAGHNVSIGVPDPERSQAARSAKVANLPLLTNQEASAHADIVVLAVPWPAAEAAVKAAGNLAGKILIDCTNPLASDLSELAIGTTTSAAEVIALQARGAHVVKAFNTIGAGNYGNAMFKGVKADGFYCGDDAQAKATVRDLIADVGLEPVDVGPLRNARYLEPLAMLWIDLAVNQKQGMDHAFKLLRR